MNRQTEWRRYKWVMFVFIKGTRTAYLTRKKRSNNASNFQQKKEERIKKRI